MSYTTETNGGNNQYLKPEAIVIIKEDNVPVMKWPLGPAGYIQTET